MVEVPQRRDTATPVYLLTPAFYLLARQATINQMLKLVVSRRHPYVNLVDIGLRRQVDQLRAENEDLRARVVTAQQEKASARQQAEELRKQKERLRLKVIDLKQAAEAQRKVRETLEAKIQVLREENEELKSNA